MDNIQYNCDTNDMINYFNFDDFIKKGKKEHYNNSAVLLITNKQYILSWTHNFGIEFHYPTLAQIYKDIHGGGRIKNSFEEFNLENQVCKYIHAKLIFINNKGEIIFYGLKNLNYKNYKSFLKFYEDYNDIIKNICANYNFNVSFFGKHNKINESKSLDNLLSHLKENLDFNKKIKNDNNEIIVGVPTNIKNIKEK